jgi:hypothetical protein
MAAKYRKKAFSNFAAPGSTTGVWFTGIHPTR